MRRFALLLPQAVEGLGVTQQLKRFRLQALWQEAVGELLAGQAEPTSIKGDLLFVRTAGPSWSQEIQLRQSDILQRLRKIMPDVALAGLRCRVGRLSHDQPVRRAADSRPIEWEQYRVDPQRLQQIEGIVSELDDPDQAARVRRFLVQLERRRLWAAEQGWNNCRLCGAFHPDPAELCPSCRLERLRRRREKLLRLLGRRPWVSHQDLLADLPELTSREYFQARLRLRSLWQESCRKGLWELPAGVALPGRIRERMLDLCMVATGVPFQQLHRKHVIYALGKVIGEAYLTDRTPPREELSKATWGMRRRWIDYSSDNQRRKTPGSPAAGRKPSLD